MKKKRFLPWILLLIVLCLTLTLSSRAMAASKVKLSQKQITLVEGQKKKLSIKGTRNFVKWKVKNKKIAGIKKKGKQTVLITGKKQGKTKITAKVNGKAYVCKLTVIKNSAESGNDSTAGTGSTENGSVDTTPQNPNTPSAPNQPSAPDLPSTPDTPNQPSAPEQPDTPVQPGTPEQPSTPNQPGTSDQPDTPSQPGEDSQNPGVPSDDTASVDAGAYSIGQVHTGDGTYYEGGYVGGCCNLDAIAQGYYVAAMNKIDYRAGGLAGAYVKVTGPNGSIYVLITDTLGEGEGQQGDIDLNIDAFGEIEPLVTGRMPIQWEIVPLPTTAPIQYVFKPESTQYWMQVQVRNHRYPVKSLEILQANGTYRMLPREEYNYFTLDNPGPGPYTFRVTDLYGHVLVDEGVSLIPGGAVDGAENFPY